MSIIKNKRYMLNEFFSSEFNQFYRKDISLNIKELEFKRRQYLILMVLVVLVILIFSVISIIFWETNLEKFIGSPAKVYFTVLTADIILFSLVLSLENKYKNEVKKVILPELLKCFGSFEPGNKRNSNDISYIRSLGLFDNFDRYHCDNRLSGIYNGEKLEIAELRLEKIKNTKRHKNIRLTIFDGIFIKLPCRKKFSGTIIIKRKPIISKDSCLSEFERYFDINLTDAAESKYLIISPFMNKMINLVNMGIGSEITISFEHGNINISLPADKNWFEFSILNSANNIKNYRYILLELFAILSITDSLNLKNNIGI